MVTHSPILSKALTMSNSKCVHEVVANKTLYQEPSSPAGELQVLSVGYILPRT